MKLDTILVLILAIVKCTGYADISWWVVFLPWIICWGLALAIGFIAEVLNE